MKFMNMKRIASTAMAGVLTLSLAVPAFATQTTIITGTYQDVEIAVEVPTTGEAQINPYGLPVTLTKSDRTTVDLVDQKITTQPMSIKNQSSTMLDVNVASFIVVPAGDVAIANAKDTGKTIKVDLEVAGLNDSELAVAATDRTLDDALIDKYADETSWANAETLAAPNAAKSAAASAITAAKSTSAMATLGAATVDGQSITYGAKSIALVRLSGDLAEDPVTGAGADDPWKTTDGFAATVVFSFKPTQKTAVTIGAAVGSTISDATANVKGFEGDTITFTFKATAGKTCTAAVTGMAAGVDAPDVEITESQTEAGLYTATFTMPKATAGVTVTVTVPA